MENLMEKEIPEELAKEFEELWEAEDAFSGLETGRIAIDLRADYGFDTEKVEQFGLWFIRKGLNEGWILAELHFCT